MRDLTGEQRQSWEPPRFCKAFGVHSSAPTLPSSPRHGAAWVPSPPAVSKATFPFKPLLALLSPAQGSFCDAGSIPGVDCVCGEMAGGQRSLPRLAGWLLMLPAVSLPCCGVKRQRVQGRLRPSTQLVPLTCQSVCPANVYQVPAGPCASPGGENQTEPVPAMLLMAPNLFSASFLSQGTAKMLGHLSPASLST